MSQYRQNRMSFRMMSQQQLTPSHSLYSLPVSVAAAGQPGQRKSSNCDDQSVDEVASESAATIKTTEKKPSTEVKSATNDAGGGGEAGIVVVKKASGFQTGLFEKLNEQRLSEPGAGTCDLAINVENRTYYAHKCLLVASCDYFAAMMLRSGMLETRQDTIELKGVSALGLRGVLDFIYTGELRLTLGNVADLVRAVSHLQVKYALELCEEFLCEQINETNCIDILNLVDLFSIKDIKSEIDAYILRNFEKLIQNEQFKKLKIDQLSFYLSSNKLKLFPEIKVFAACVNWWQTSTDKSDQSSFYELAKLVRFHTMKPEEFINMVTKHDLMKNDAQCRELLIQGYEYFALPSKQYTCTSPQSIIRNEPVMVCVNESMYILNKKEDCWQYLCQSHATSKILSQKFVVVNNFLYACGGYSEKERETCDKCYRFDPRNGQWQSIASMNEKRQFFTLAACNDTIVAVGGVFGSIGNFYATFPISSPIECYSIERNEWTSVPIDEGQVPILKWPGVCVFRRRNDDDDDDDEEERSRRQYVFVVCGKHVKKNTLSENAYLVDVDRCQVEVCPGPLTARFNPSVFYYDHRIILFAGEDEKFRLAPCIESFDLRTRQWTEIATVPISLSYQCISSTRMQEGKINYIIEEHDGPFSEAYVLRSASFDIDRMRFDTTIELPIPSTLASKWCYLVFPLEFLDKYYSLSADDD